MVAPLAVATGFKGIGMVAASLAAAGAFFLATPRARAWAALAALVLTPVLLLGELWNSSQLETLRSHPAELLALGVVGIVVMVALAALFLRRPLLMPVLAVAALPFRIPVQAGGQSALLLVPLYIVVGGGGLAYVWERLRPRPMGAENGYRLAPAERSPGYVELALLIAVTLYSVQSVYSTDFETALKNVAFFYIPFALLLKLITSLEWTARLETWCLRVTVGLSLVFVAIGVGEFATKRLLWNPKVLEANQFRSYFRVNSLFFDPNIYGRYLAIVMVLLATLLLWSRRRRHVVWVTVLLAVLWVGLVLSLSQSSFAALLVGLAVLAAVRWRAAPVIAASVAAVAVLAIVVFAIPGSVHLQGHSAKSLNRATSGRVDLMRGGLRMFADRPIYGYGSGSFAERFRAREKKGQAQAASASHTIPITVAAEQGVIGLAAYLFVLVASFRLLFGGLLRLRREEPGARLFGRMAVAAAFAALVFHTLLYADFLEDPIAWTLLGIAIALRRGPPRTRGGRVESSAGAAAESVPG
ncbi:MAG TPA: O-antigen ligase family protein [Thermoleophilaceae bacterium]|nr:O-antigen ligase family protein [Thermoleophilaceae bacterium]